MRWQFLAVFPFLLCSCTSVKTIPLSNASSRTSRVSHLAVADIEVYRTTRPRYAFKEVGMATVQGNDPSVEKIYPLLREEAHKQGADAVIGFKIKTEEVVVPTSSTSCNGTGACTTSMSSHTELRYTATGTLIRRSAE